MFTRILFTTLMAMVLLVSIAVAGDDAKPVEKAKEITLKNQTNCPVMGGKIDSSVYTDIQGQRIYHCCAGCIKPLQKDPDKYFKKAAADGVLFENVQTNCPVSDEVLNKDKVAMDFEGRRLYFCCNGCIEKFEKDPQKYLATMDEPAEKTETKAKMKMPDDGHDHSGHDHGGH